jgi:tRNA modification GTPase
MNSDTICALATANGTGAIGIIRISGKNSFKIVNKIFEGKTADSTQDFLELVIK